MTVISRIDRKNEYYSKRSSAVVLDLVLFKEIKKLTPTFEQICILLSTQMLLQQFLQLAMSLITAIHLIQWN